VSDAKLSNQQLEQVCDCSTKDALVCKEHPDCRPSYCKMRRFDPPITAHETSMEWMSVKNELPKKDGFYWCYLSECPPQTYPQKAIRFTRAGKHICADIEEPSRWWTSWAVSHWMELPERPKNDI